MKSTEIILSNAMNTKYGWTKSNCMRCIRLGNKVNCNGEILKNYLIKESIIEIMKKFEIIEYEIENIDNKFEFSYELKINENQYQILSDKIKDNKITMI